jgi:replicative DNA helicase
MIDLDAVASQEFILGSFLRDGATITNVEAMNNIPKEAFTVLMLRDIFTVCKSITDKAEDMDALHVDDCLTRMLSKRKAPEYDGQYQRISSLHHNSMNGFSITAHVKKLIKSYKLRIAQHSMYSIGQAIESGSDIDDVVDTVENIISQLRLAGQTYQTQHISELVECYADTLEARDGELGIRTGFADCDNLIGKVMPGNLIVVSARPGQGKTEFACAWAVNAAINQGKNILVFSLEMQTSEIMDRFVALDSNMPISTLDSAQSLNGSDWGESAWGKVAASLSRLHPVNISIHDEPGITLSKMRQVIKDTERKTGKLDMVVIDYMQLMKDPSAKGRIEEVSNISRGLKEMAKEFKFPVMALAQLNRECEKHDREPRPSDIAESGQIEKDADKIIFLHCPNKNEPSQPNFELSKVIFAKVRQGRTGAACLRFTRGHFLDSDAAFMEQQDISASEAVNQSKFAGKKYGKS